MRGTPLGIRLFTRPAVVVSGTTWDPANSTGWTLSGANLVATHSGGSDSFVYATTAKTSGVSKVTVTALGTGGTFIVIGVGPLGMSNYPGVTTGLGYRSDGHVLLNASVVDGYFTGGAVGYTTADLIEVDFTQTTVTIKKNSSTVWTRDISLDLGGSPGSWYPAAASNDETGTVLTGDFSGW